MAAQTQGIQQLLSAEKRASEQVNEARKRKAKRMKQAKDEAQAEINKYRDEREGTFKDYEAKYMGSRGDVAAKIQQDTEAELNGMNSRVAKNKAQVIDSLLELVCTLKPEVHKNLTLRQSMQKA